jgi:PqqD family protein of HPr-rel-A system
LVSEVIEKKIERLSLWSLSHLDQFIFHTWDDDEFVVAYNTFSGDTHLLDGLGYEILQLLALANSSTKILVSALAELFPDVEVAQIQELTETTLQQLFEVGFIVEFLQ